MESGKKTIATNFNSTYREMDLFKNETLNSLEDTKNPKKLTKTANFDGLSYKSGKTKVVFKGIMFSLGDMWEKCAVKVFRNTDLQGSKSDCEKYQENNRQCELYIQKFSSSTIHVEECYTAIMDNVAHLNRSFKTHMGTRRKICKNECVIFERWIAGNWETFISNTGQIEVCCPTEVKQLYDFVKNDSGGQLCIEGLKGVKTRNGHIFLTTPRIVPTTTVTHAATQTH